MYVMSAISYFNLVVLEKAGNIFKAVNIFSIPIFENTCKNQKKLTSLSLNLFFRKTSSHFIFMHWLSTLLSPKHLINTMYFNPIFLCTVVIIFVFLINKDLFTP
ncbi:hypothetical protein SAMN05216191_106158 [Paenibacillus jilunlii]|uniref:Uncharacterized protein n=1 Tax=Paenibacillus jilunlii TaxID=682956 RepID=A0A1G9NEZ7_9BACL|nr:hypothetical protein SAMN05216191_106158 [Paenibacillus jilunlii]